MQLVAWTNSLSLSLSIYIYIYAKKLFATSQFYDRVPQTCT
jgi:hypothetical protein